MPQQLHPAVSLAFSLAATTSVAFSPTVLWSRQLLGSGKLSGVGIRKGNGVVSSQNGKHIWVTDDEGSLHIFDTEDQSKEAVVYTPPTKAGHSLESRSSVRLFETDDGVGYAVYNVIDTSRENSGVASSRMIAINGDGPSFGSLRWASEIEGIAVGTPEIGSNGTFVFTSHNIGDRGFVSVINDSLLGQRCAKQAGDHVAPYGEVTKGRSEDGKDVIFWGEYTKRGYADLGRIYIMDTTSGFNLATGRDLPTSTATGLTTAEEDLWYTGKNSTVFGWVGGRKVHQHPKWKRRLDSSLRNSSVPTASKISVLLEKSLLFVSSASTSFFCLNASTGSIVWRVNSSSTIMTEAKVSPIGKYVYLIEHNDGSVVERDAMTGQENWRFNCSAMEGAHETCQDSIEAEFSLSSDGNRLYWGDIFGKVTALKVGDYSSAVPNISESSIQSAFPTTTATTYPSDMKTMQPSQDPTGASSDHPSEKFTPEPSSIMSALPTTSASIHPSDTMTIQPSQEHTGAASDHLNEKLTSKPSSVPSALPTTLATIHPNGMIAMQPSQKKTGAPSDDPSEKLASLSPTTYVASQYQSQQPSSTPTMSTLAAEPVAAATISPTMQPSLQIKDTPFYDSRNESNFPSIMPSPQSVFKPTGTPIQKPTSAPNKSFSSDQTSGPKGMLPTSPSSNLRAQAPTFFQTSIPTSTPTSTKTSVPTKVSIGDIHLATTGPSSSISPSKIRTFNEAGPSQSPSLGVINNKIGFEPYHPLDPTDPSESIDGALNSIESSSSVKVSRYRVTTAASFVAMFGMLCLALGSFL